MRRLAALGAGLMLLVPGSAFPADVSANAVAFLQNLSLPMPSPRSIVFCHGFTCAFRTEIGFGPADQVRMSQMMAEGRGSAEAERKAIAKTEVWFEKRVAPQTGTGHAKARSGGLTIGGDPTQFDCIDASSNTTSLLILLSELKLLRYHDIDAPISRLFAGGPHFTATIKDRKTGQAWTVDPWTHDHGELPDVWTVERWKNGG